MADLLTYGGDARVIDTLRAAIQMEGHLNLQYRMDWRIAKNLGIKSPACKLKDFGHDTHCWLKLVTDRCLFLGGDTGYDVGTVVQSDSFQSMLQRELDLEVGVVKPYEQAIQTAMQAFDDSTRNLFEHLIKWHQKHVLWLLKQLNMITIADADTGESRYLLQNS